MSEEDKAFVSLLINRTGSSSCMEALLVVGRALEEHMKAYDDWDTARFGNRLTEAALALADTRDVLRQLVVP